MNATHDTARTPHRKGIARLGAFLANLSSGRLSLPAYERRQLPPWEVERDALVVVQDVQVVDVVRGELRPERNIVIRNDTIEAVVTHDELDRITREQRVGRTLSGRGLFAIPGLSDLHAHLSAVTEYDMRLRSLRYFDSQRQKNCEEAVAAGCTFVRDSGGAAAICRWLRDEIEAGRLVGPRMAPSYEVLSPRGGMWDIGRIGNALAPMIFGGKILHFVTTDDEIRSVVARLVQLGSESFKTYFEEMPLYGGTRETRYAMFSPEQAQLMRRLADEHERPVEAHSMFVKGSRIVAEAGFDSIAHLTVDAPYDLELARTMARNHTAIVPTLSLGCYLAMNCGDRGAPQHPDYQFFREKLDVAVRDQIAEVAVPELRASYERFRSWLLEEHPQRVMPMVGEVYPERVHGFAVHAAESLRNLRDAGVRIGVGTDGGTGITFAGRLEVELAALVHFGFSAAEVLRMATLGNMEILGRDHELGSIEQGKLADIVLLSDNPLVDVSALRQVRAVLKGGRLVHDASVDAARAVRSPNAA